MKIKPTILLTNDDGIHSNGIRCLWESLKDFAEVIVIAPMDQQSGAGASITVDKPLKAKSVNLYENTLAWMVDGRPADCVKLGLGALLKSKPDFIVSGINHGSNAGRNVLYSGTVGATIQGIIRGIPGIAFSYVCYEAKDFSHIKPYIPKILEYVLEHPLPKGSLLNVNFPHLPAEKIKGWKMARQGLGHWVDALREEKHPEGHSLFWLDEANESFMEHDESDVAWLEKGYITAVPIHVNELTDHGYLTEKKSVFEDQFLFRD